jgi:asparagine synthase (glutamine-hydrolysing)
MQEVQRRGIRGVLEGIGGDELLFSGFNHLALLARRGKFFTLLHQLRLDAANYSLTPSWLLFHRVISPMVPMPVKRALRPFLRRLGPRSEPLRLVRADFARTHGIYEHAVSLPQFPTRVQQNLYDATLRGWSTVACEMNQLFASRFQTECRWPFLSRPLIEFLLAVPQEQRWHRHESKFLLRRAMRGILPEKVRRRTDKASFNVVADLELKQRQAAKVDALFRNSLLVAAGVGDRSALNQLFARYRAGAPRLAATVELVIGLELFCRATHDRMWRA